MKAIDAKVATASRGGETERLSSAPPLRLPNYSDPEMAATRAATTAWAEE